jgi:hypothetical protein
VDLTFKQSVGFAFSAEASLGAFGARGNDEKTVHHHADSSPSIKLQIACSLRDQIDELKQICAAKVRV